MRRLLLVLLALLAIATPASAGNGVAGITVKLERTLTSVSVLAIVSGDDDSTAVLRLFYRPDGSSSAYDSGMVMVKRRGQKIHAGRILWLTPGQRVQYYIEATDAAGGLNTTADTVSAAGARGIIATGPVFYVNKATGNDANAGTSAASPKKSITSALSALSLSTSSGLNGGVIVAPGIYYERLDLSFGTPGTTSGWFLIGDGTNRDSTIVDGSYEPGVNGRANDLVALSWTATGVDSIYRTYYPAGDSCNVVVLNWGERLHRKTSMTELIQDAGGERSGWWWQNDTLYVQRANGLSPSGTVLHAGYRDNLLWIQKSNWRVANLTVRFAGGPGGAGYAVRVSNNSSGVSLDSLRLYGLQRQGVIVTSGSDRGQFVNSTFDGLTVGGFVYGASKSRIEESVEAIGCAAAAWSIRGNSATGSFNGFDGGGVAETDSTGGSHCEVSSNTVTNVADDAFEFEASHAINLLLAENTVSRCGHGISSAPIWTGPALYLYNTLLGASGGAFKQGFEPSDGYGLYAHNTAVTSVVNGAAVNSVGGRFKQKQWRNNILIGRGGYTLYNNYTSATDTVGTYTNDFNYDVLDSIGTTRLVRWKGTNDYSLASLRANAVGFVWEANGQQGSVAFADTASARYWTVWGARTIDAGCRIPGINTTAGRFRGAAPDAGRFEFPDRVRREEK